MNVCADDIFWTTEHFVTELGMVMQHMSRTVMWKNLFAICKVKLTTRAHITKIWLCLLYLLNCWFCGNQTFSMVHHHKPEYLVEKLDYCIQGQGHSEFSRYQWMLTLSRWYLLNVQTFCRQTWYGDASSWASVMQKDWFAVFKVKVTARAHMIRIWQFATKLDFMVHYHKPECLLKTLDCCV